ncbi:MAG TPA: methyltransferase domain-containing protein [Candidatus Aenigmarchaeota archaeon]|nr:methyltransferase domain-containing protein [Candidatus Aenigmarchaeota archaeon]
MKMKQPDIFKNLKRGPQIITWKDASLIAGFSGAHAGYKIVDAGSGSGFLAIFLGNLVRPGGKVISYEKRKEFAKIARENVKRAKLEDIVIIKEKDIARGIEEHDVDLITLDMAEPWNVVKHANKALKEKGFVVSYSPNIEQVKRFVEECKRHGLRHELTIECILREMVIREKASRPQNKGIMHTGYITFARKVKREGKDKEHGRG